MHAWLGCWSLCTVLKPLFLLYAGMFKDRDFQTKAGVDKHGRKVPGGSAGKGEDLKRYYRLKDEVCAHSSSCHITT